MLGDFRVDSKCFNSSDTVMLLSECKNLNNDQIQIPTQS